MLEFYFLFMNFVITRPARTAATTSKAFLFCYSESNSPVKPDFLGENGGSFNFD